jgi:hypothetical protein
MSKTNNEEPQYTEEEMKIMRSNMVKFYTEELKFIKKQEEYERLLADIEEHKVRKYTMMARAAQIFASAEKANDPGSDQDVDKIPKMPAEEKAKRKLKTEE